MKKRHMNPPDVVERLVNDNIRFVYYVQKRLQPNACGSEYDDIIAALMFGLFKAALYFDESKSNFGTFAYRCMQNEVFMLLRKNKKLQVEVSLEKPLAVNDSETKWLLLEDVLADPNTPFEYVETKELVQTALESLDELEHDVIMDYFFYNISQIEISRKYGYSQSYMSRVMKKGLLKARKHIENKIRTQKRKEQNDERD